MNLLKFAQLNPMKGQRKQRMYYFHNNIYKINNTDIIQSKIYKKKYPFIFSTSKTFIIQNNNLKKNQYCNQMKTLEET